MGGFWYCSVAERTRAEARDDLSDQRAHTSDSTEIPS